MQIRLIMSDEIHIGVDTGGTFTDFFISCGKEIQTLKIPSTPKDPSLSILTGIKKLTGERRISSIIHGTTVGTNALLEKKGGNIVLVTTEGFEDILTIKRQTRTALYDLIGEDQTFLIQKKNCLGVEERTLSDGRVKKKVSKKSLSKIIDHLKKNKADAVAVCLIHSYVQDQNEKLIQRYLESRGYMVSASREILPEYREYERTAATAVNAYLMPVMSRYLSELERKVTHSRLKIMQSNEGYISTKIAKKQPIRTALSGPTGGVLAAYHICRSAGFKKVISFDMGGTSTDVSLIEGSIPKTQESFIGEFPVRLPIIDIHTVGSGGGSIASLDKGGSLRVGPESAGADPGPACYGQAMSSTVTDANLVLGRLPPDLFLNGNFPVFPERSREALSRLARKINRPLIQTAQGILEIANANMERAIRVISIEKGHDIRDFSLFSFGGAGGLHAVEIMSHLNMKRVIVPLHAGVLAAKGFLFADSIKDFTRSILVQEKDLTDERMERDYSQLVRSAQNEMRTEGFKEDEVRCIRSLDMRYLGQSYEITLPYTNLDLVSRSFHREHKKMYSYCHQDRSPEIVNIRLKAAGSGKKIKPIKRKIKKTPSPVPVLTKQPVYFSHKKTLTPVYERKILTAGVRVSGPAVIADIDSTILVPPEYRFYVDAYLNLIIERR